jgi:hypothetical protein
MTTRATNRSPWLCNRYIPNSLALRGRLLPGGAEGCKPSAICFFSPVLGDFAAQHGRKTIFSGAAPPPPNPHRVSPVIHWPYAVIRV